MSPSAFAQQRALPPTSFDAKGNKQEASWPRRLKEKASIRSLKPKSSLTHLKKLGSSSSNITQNPPNPPLSPRSPAQQSFAAGEAPPPVPPIPLRYVLGSQEPILEASPSGMIDGSEMGKAPQLGTHQKAPPIPPTYGLAREAPGNESLGQQETPEPEIAPFLDWEKWAPTKKPRELGSPMSPSPSPNQTRNFDSFGSTTSLNTRASTPSREFPSGPEDPYWDEAVARVRHKVRLEQEKERRERKAAVRAERKYIRSVSREREGRFKWAKKTVEMLIGKYDEHGWLPKKDPKDFNDDDWNFVLEVLNHKDTKALRDRLFEKSEWIKAGKARRIRYQEEMRNNPTSEFLAIQKAKKEKERKEYGFRKACGMLTEEEKERERERELHNTPPSVGLGISVPSGPRTPSTQGRRSPHPRGRIFHRPEDSTTSGKTSTSESFDTSAGQSVEQMTDVFNTDSFNPRISRLGSDEVKRYIQRKSTESPVPPTPTPHRPAATKSLDPRKRAGRASSSTSSPAVKQTPAPRAKLVKKAASTNELRKAYARPNRLPLTPKEHPAISPPFRLPTPGIHPALRDSASPQETATPSQLSVAKSRMPNPRNLTSPVTEFDSPPIPSGVHPALRGSESSPATAVPSQPSVVESQSPIPSSVISPVTRSDSPPIPLGVQPALLSFQNSIGVGIPTSLIGAAIATNPSVAKSRTPKQRHVTSPFAGSDSPATPGGVRRRLINTAFTSLSRDVPKLKQPPKPRKPSTAVEIPEKPVTIVHSTCPPCPTPSNIRAEKGRRRYAPHIRKPSKSIVFDTKRSASDPVAPSTPSPSVPSPPNTTGHMGSQGALAPPHPGKRIIASPDIHSAAGGSTEAKPTSEAKNSQQQLLLPQGVARLSRVPGTPDAGDFSAVGVQPDFELDAAPAPQSIVTPRDRVTAKRSGTFESDVAQAATLGSVEESAAQSGAMVRPLRLDSLDWNQRSMYRGKGRAHARPVHESSGMAQDVEDRRRPTQASSKDSKDSVDTYEDLELPDKDWMAEQEKAQRRFEQYRGLAQAVRARAPPAGQIDASFDSLRPPPATTENMLSRAEVEETLEKHMPPPKATRAAVGLTRQGMTSLGHQQSMPPTSFRSFTRNLPPTSPGRLATFNPRSMSQGTSSNAPATPSRAAAYNPRTNSNSSSAEPASAPLRHGKFEPFTPSRRGIQQSGLDTNSDDLDVSFAEVINAWQQHPSSPNPTPGSHNSQASRHNQEIELLRSELGLEPVREHVSGEPRHPNHHYSWNTTKMMCRRVHNPGVGFPSLPSPTPAGRPAHMAEYAAEFFVGSPYTDESSSPERCSHCEAFCCRFADAVAQLETRTTDVFMVQERRRLQGVVAKLRARKPNGVEEWDSFLKCSQCERRFCPHCISLCSDDMCQEPVCIQCKEGTSLCKIHNFF